MNMIFAASTEEMVRAKDQVRFEVGDKVRDENGDLGTIKGFGLLNFTLSQHGVAVIRLASTGRPVGRLIENLTKENREVAVEGERGIP